MSQALNSLKVKAISTFTSAGKRALQEDYLLAESERGVFVVADGFGGPGIGAVAAKKSCESVRNFLFKEAGDLDATLPFVLRSYYSLAGNVLFNALIHANRQVKLGNKNKNVHEKGGASVIAGFLDGNLLAIANVGVCTAWLIRHGVSVELVMPRTFGKLANPFERDVLPEYQAPLMALGISEDLEPEVFEYRVREGDWIVFCTDGMPPSVSQVLGKLQEKNHSLVQLVEEIKKSLNQFDYIDNAAISLAIL